MKAVVYEDFNAPLKLTTVPDPVPVEGGVVVRVLASGICRSDWHGWRGHDPDITSFPHVPGHELAGVVEEVGADVTRWTRGDRVTVPFCGGCGSCPECVAGNHHICDDQFVPGFKSWGSFAEYVAIGYADPNLVRLPDEIGDVAAASLGCRFSTSFRAIVAQGRTAPGEWVAVHGCGGIGLSAIMIAVARGAQVVAIDIDDTALALARELGASVTVNASEAVDVAGAVHEASGRGAHVSLDALGSAETFSNSLKCLRKRGRHVQVGLVVGDDYPPPLATDLVIARELEIYGSHGMQASHYDEMLEMIVSGRLDPTRIIGRTVSLEEAPAVLESMGASGDRGIAVIDRF
jgi:alcohol dehydrogenase